MTEFLSPLLAQESNSGSPLQFLLLPLLLGGLFFVLIRPQRKRQKELQQLRDQIGVGDEVMTSSGIYGFITGEEADLFWLEIDDDVQIRISKAAIHSRIPDASETDSEADSDSKAIAATDASDAPADDADASDDAGADDDAESDTGTNTSGALRSAKKSGAKPSSQRPAAKSSGTKTSGTKTSGAKTSSTKTSGASRSKASKSKTAGAEAES